MVVHDQERLVRQPRLDRLQAAQLRFVVVRPVVVVDADEPVAQGAALDHLEGVPLEDRRTRGAATLQVLLQAGAARGRQRAPCHLRRAEREAVDRDEVALVPAHRPDQARAVVRADLDIALARRKQACRQIEQREHVLGREVGYARDHVVEAAPAWVLRAGEVVEEPGQLGGEALGVHPQNLPAGR